jgi:hypothetical protein
MALTSRSYLFEDGGAIKRIPRRVLELLVFGKDAMPEYANSVQRVAEVRVNNVDGNPIEIIEANGSFWTFDEEGRIDEGLRANLSKVFEFAFPEASGGKVVSLTPSLKRQQFQREHRWQLSKEHLDWIAADVWPTADDGPPKVSVAKSKEPKRPPLTHEGKIALRELQHKIAIMKSDLESLSEPALKGLAFAARQASEFDNDLWTGVAADCDRQREIKSRHRTGRGVWFAVIEAMRTYPGSDVAEVLDEAFEKCEGKKAAIVAARRLLKEHAHKFEENTSIEARLYCELEWKPLDTRRSGTSTSVEL